VPDDPRERATPYERLFIQRRPTPEQWDGFVRDALVPLWLDAYDAATPWATHVLEIPQGALTYLFDMAPSMGDIGDDRVVAVWGRSTAATAPRDRTRQAGFIPVPQKWSKAGYDRGHFVSHAAGGGMDMNFFPQAKGLNRGSSERGREWRALERLTVTRPGTPLLVRPTYAADGWVPEFIDYCIVIDGDLRVERFLNHD
jgi:hypothetical protein